MNGQPKLVLVDLPKLVLANGEPGLHPHQEGEALVKKDQGRWYLWSFGFKRWLYIPGHTTQQQRDMLVARQRRWAHQDGST